jgi:predicted membrane-bound spermidine synthase
MKPLLLLKRLRAYEIIAFVTGFTLMVYELVASRILAPSIGSSTYVWTSVIGVIIAALSLGYAAGGWLADTRTRKLDIAWLLLACAISVLGTLVFADGILELISGTALDARVKGLLAATILFTPTSFLLGTLSPYLVRLHTESLDVAGRSVASLSALNAVGGIIGTFSAGFLFFGYFGSQQTLGLVVAVLLAASWLILPSAFWRQRALACVAVILLVATTMVPAASAQTIASIDTPSTHYEIKDMQVNGKPARILAMGPEGWQSGIYLEEAGELPFYYTQVMAGMAHASSPKSMLVLGGGALTLPAYLANRHPHAQVDVVEIDPQLESIATKYFGFEPVPNLRVITADGRAFLNANTTKYDMIFVDIFSDTDLPFATTTTQYVQALHKSLAADGTVVVNIIGSDNKDCLPMLGALNSTYSKTFAYREAFPSNPDALYVRQNITAIYANKKPTWTMYYIRGTQLPTGRILTDNYAPVERLHQQCKGTR